MNPTGPYHIWTKGTRVQLSDHFWSTEFECRCKRTTCQEQRIHVDLLAKLESARRSLTQPITITSGFRCTQHQYALRAGGAQTAFGTSTHELGNAVDIVTTDMHHLRGICEQLFSAIGYAATFLHVDLRDDKLRRWNYL